MRRKHSNKNFNILGRDLIMLKTLSLTFLKSENLKWKLLSLLGHVCAIEKSENRKFNSEILVSGTWTLKLKLLTALDMTLGCEKHRIRRFFYTKAIFRWKKANTWIWDAKQDWWSKKLQIKWDPKSKFLESRGMNLLLNFFFRR